MSTIELRKRLKKQIDRIPPARLASLVEYVQFLSSPPLTERLVVAEKAIAAGKGVNWRSVRNDV